MWVKPEQAALERSRLEHDQRRLRAAKAKEGKEQGKNKEKKKEKGKGKAKNCHETYQQRQTARDRAETTLQRAQHGSRRGHRLAMAPKVWFAVSKEDSNRMEDQKRAEEARYQAESKSRSALTYCLDFLKRRFCRSIPCRFR
jgi:hypothetical protein